VTSDEDGGCPPELDEAASRVEGGRCEVRDGRVVLEACYPVSDLRERGVEACARVYVDDEGNIHNRMVFKKDGREGEVTCVHTAIANLSDLGEFDEDEVVELAESTEGEPVKIPPGEHFFALASYTRGVAEMGVKKLALSSYAGPHDPATLPFGFNVAMQRQVARAIKRVDPGATGEIVEELAWKLPEVAGLEWIENRFDILDDAYGLSGVICKDPELFEMYGGLEGPVKLKVACAAANVTPHHLLVKLASDGNAEVRVAVASNPNAPVGVLEMLAGDGVEKVRRAVANNIRTPLAVLERLAWDADDWTRDKALWNIGMPRDEREWIEAEQMEIEDTVRFAPPEILRELARDDRPWVRSLVTRNPNVTKDVLEVLAGDENSGVRAIVALNEKTPGDALRKLTGDISNRVRMFVARNPNTPAEALRVLIDDPDWSVRAAVAQNSNTPSTVLKELVGDDRWEVRIALTKNPKTPPDVLDVLAGSENREIRLNVARNPNTPPWTLERLASDARDGRDEMNLIVARHRNTPPRVLRGLAGSEASAIREEVAENPNAPREVIEVLARDANKWVRLRVAKNPNVPPEILAVLARDRDDVVRLGVAGNPNTPTPVLEELVADEDIMVAEVARDELARRGLSGNGTGAEN